MRQSGPDALIAALNEHQRIQKRVLPNMYGLPRAEFMMMKAIERHLEEKEEESGVRASELSKATGISKPGISQILNALEEKSLIQRTMAKNDRRGISVRLTPGGQTLMQDCSAFLYRVVEEIAHRLGEEDTDRLADLLHRLNEILQVIDYEALKEDRNR